MRATILPRVITRWFLTTQRTANFTLYLKCLYIRLRQRLIHRPTGAHYTDFVPEIKACVVANVDSRVIGHWRKNLR